MVWQVNNEAEAEAARQLDDEVLSASDRATAVIAGSFVEGRLAEFLKSIANHKGDMWSRLTHSSAPLGSFSVKIDLAFLFGLISEEAHADLVRIKDIRNQFAHRMDIQDFMSQSIRDKCMNLKFFEHYILREPEFQKRISLLPRDPLVGPLVKIDEKQLFVMAYPDMTDFNQPRQRFMWSARVFIMAFGLLTREFDKIPARQRKQP